MSVSLALLICGSLTGKLYAEHGDYSAVFTRFFQSSLPNGSDAHFTLDPYDVQKLQYPSDDQVGTYDAIVLTGSAASAYENVEWVNKLIAYIRHIAESKPHVKLIGICFGHQIIGRALGGECVPNGGRWEVGPIPLDLTDLGKQVFGIKSLNIQEMHRDHVPAVPPTFYLLGSTPLSMNQGMATLKDIHIFTVQGHPEFTQPIVDGLVEQRASSGVIDAEAAADAKRRQFWQNDGVPVVGKAIWGILGVPA
ncbi:hypothetical protein K443DRAFT_99142 [Laccaria amethystina LaAM-08-1]|uniref:Glutamine amidotransferase domain-containing protein n=1 Tax=Laccaria amethystina LaAM-08-1 TaxID=1095629 RepID=A0A0C9XI33_9AGAR|nr:hypothetical protein K443DRAFT_99142 [Laccaria amethystina LaAM-08-1]